MKSHALVLLGLTAVGMLCWCRNGCSQVPVDQTRIDLEVPSDARVSFNGQLIQTTGHLRQYAGYGLEPGRVCHYELVVEMERNGEPMRYEEHVVVRTGELKRISVPETSFTAQPRTPPQAAPPLVSETLPPSSSLLLLSAPVPMVPADERAAFFAASPRDLKLSDQLLVDTNTEIRKLRSSGPLLWPAVLLDGEGEAYAELPAGNEQPIVLVRTGQPREVSGVLLLPTEKRLVQVKFRLPAASARPENHRAFYERKAAHYRQLLAAGIPGGAWFRYEVRQACTAVCGSRPGRSADTSPIAQISRSSDELMNWFDLLTGGRAISENLWLDRQLDTTDREKATIPVSDLPGINVQPFQWEPLISNLNPETDPLAAAIPADQHAVFFPSPEAAIRLARQAAGSETVVLRLAQPRSEQSRIQERYEQQFSLTLNRLAAILKPELARSVALTGSDPHVSMGTDVALLIESPNPKALGDALAGELAAHLQQPGQAEAVKGEIDGLSYYGVRSPDRRMSSYVAVLGEHTVVLTNSLGQLQRLGHVRAEPGNCLARQPEYTWFRDRYRRGDPKETALVVISDATIRRWCGPSWRIGQARRIWNAAVLAEAQAMAADSLLRPDDRPAGKNAQTPQLPRDLKVGKQGVYSLAHGSLEFLTPIIEEPVEQVSQAEASAYNQWRGQYEQQWQKFDPIALRLELNAQQLAADLTITPLTMRTEYAQARAVVEGTSLRRGVGDPHDALLQVVLAVNEQTIKSLNGLAAFALQGRGYPSCNILECFTGTVSLWVDDDPSLKDLAKRLDAERRAGGNMPWQWAPLALQLPVGARFEVTSGLKLTKFLLGLRTFIEETSPGMFRWELRTYREHTYTKVSLGDARQNVPQGDADLARQLEQVAIYYTTSGDALMIALREDVLRHAIDRSIVARAAKADGKPAAPRNNAWTGKQVGVHVDKELLRLLSDLAGDDYQNKMQEICWGNLPILNEWKRRYPDQDPLRLHQRLWQARLVCPGGGNYVWDPAWQTYTSTVYGQPAAPKQGPAIPPLLQTFRSGDFGLKFEDRGLRARISFSLEPVEDKMPSGQMKTTK